MKVSRREVGKMMLAVPAAGLAWGSRLVAAQATSRWAGVQVGLNVPYSFKTGNYISTEEIIRRTVQLGASGLELRAQPVELALGSPQAIAAASATGGRQGGRGGGRGSEASAEQAAAAEALRKWRLAVPMSKVAAIRKQYNDAGITINIVKWDDIFTFTVTPDVVDYAFEVAKALGASGISCEMPSEANLRAETTRIGQFADRHQMRVAYHNHATVTQDIFEQAFSTAKFNGANLDLGHFMSGTRTSPIPFLKQHHHRVVFLHLKDKLPSGSSVPHGQGEVPIREALQLIRDNKWNIPAIIELDYQIPQGSDAMAENARCLDYARQSLLG